MPTSLITAIGKIRITLQTYQRPPVLRPFEILHEVSELSSRMRAEYSIKTPDAIQIAVRVLYGADKFLTNDSALKKVTDIEVLALDDFLENKKIYAPPTKT